MEPNAKKSGPLNSQMTASQEETKIKEVKEEKEYNKKKYEATRVRTYNKDWEKGNAWLCFDEGLDLMKCTVCCDFYACHI